MARPIDVRKPLILLAFSALCALVGTLAMRFGAATDADLVQTVQSGVTQLQSQLNAALGTPATAKAQNWEQTGVAVVRYVRGQAVQWSSIAVPFEHEVVDRTIAPTGIIRLGTGHYLYASKAKNDTLTIAYGLLRATPPYHNALLPNGWGPAFNISAHIQIAQAGPDALAVGNPVLFHIRRDYSGTVPPPLWAVGFWVLALGLMVVALSMLITQMLLGPWGIVAFGLILLAIRAFMLMMKWPEALYATELFQPGVHASSNLSPSLGDLLLHLLFVQAVVHRLVGFNLSLRPGAGGLAAAIILVVQGALFLLSLPLVRTLIFDSSFSLDLADPFSFSPYSLLALVIAALGLGLILQLGSLVGKALPSRFPLWAWGLVVVMLVVIFACLLPWQVAVVASLVVAAMLGYLHRQGQFSPTTFTIGSRLPLVVLLSVFATAIWGYYGTEAEHRNRMEVAEGLDQGNDPVIEFLFAQVREDIVNDRQVRNCLAVVPNRNDELLALLRERFLYEQWQVYDLSFDLFTSTGQLLLTDQGNTGHNLNEFVAMEEAGQLTMSRGLILQNGTNGGYLGRIDLGARRGGAAGHVLFIGLRPKGMLKQTGLAELLLDETVSRKLVPERYSVARYAEGLLIESRGDFAYPLQMEAWAGPSRSKESNDGSYFMDDGNFDHLVHRHGEGALEIVSQPRAWLPTELSAFSYLFIVLLVAGIALTLAAGGPKALVGNRFGLRERINLTLTGTLAFSLVLVAVATVYFISKQNRDRNRDLLLNKAEAVLTELGSGLADRAPLGQNETNNLGRLLIKYANMFETDINLYSPKGDLLASSRPRLYEVGLRSTLMDPGAFQAMAHQHRSNHVQTEQIGQMRFLAAYLPVRGTDGATMAYIGLPYYAREEAMRRESAQLLATIINIFVLLLLASIALGLLLTENITGPLLSIRQSLHGLRLEGGNRAIEWAGNDEIGDLVKEYNRTLNELVRSAEMLARSEREMAWREMAKQVAHEIKNPLTPMRLSIQMLERSHRDGAPDLGARIERTTQMLIEQIDALSNIATEFSNFAQMPRPVLAQVDLSALLEGIGALHGHDERVRLNISVPNEAVPVNGDRDQLLRVFNNLVKNALQAIPDGADGLISINLNLQGNEACVAVTDNGTGMPTAVAERVFVPSFSTKTSGMGLGLAMVKGMVEGMGGTIRFETAVGVSTTFFVVLPVGEGKLEMEN